MGLADQIRPGIQQRLHGEGCARGGPVGAGPFGIAIARHMPGDVIEVLGPEAAARKRPPHRARQVEQAGEGIGVIVHGRVSYSSIHDTCAATIFQPSGKRAQLWV